MKNILLWDSRFPDRAPRQLLLNDVIASALVRSGVGAPVNPSDYASLSAGGALSAADLTEVVLQHGYLTDLVRVMVPKAVAEIGQPLGLLNTIGGVTLIPPAPPAGVPVITGTLAMEDILTAAVIGVPDAIKWQVAPWNGGAPESWADISGGIGLTLLLTAETKLKAVRVAARYGSTWFFSAPTGQVTPFYSFTGFTSGQTLYANRVAGGFDLFYQSGNTAARDAFTFGSGIVTAAGTGSTVANRAVHGDDVGSIYQEVTVEHRGGTGPQIALRVSDGDPSKGIFVSLPAAGSAGTLTLSYFDLYTTSQASAGLGSSATWAAGDKARVWLKDDGKIYAQRLPSGTSTWEPLGNLTLPATLGGGPHSQGTSGQVARPDTGTRAGMRTGFGAFSYDNLAIRAYPPTPTFTVQPLRIGMNMEEFSQSSSDGFLRDLGRKVGWAGVNASNVSTPILPRDGQSIVAGGSINTSATGQETALGMNAQGFFKVDLDGRIYPTHTTASVKLRRSLPQGYYATGEYEMQLAPPNTALTGITYGLFGSGITHSTAQNYDPATGKMRFTVTSTFVPTAPFVEFNISSMPAGGLPLPSIYPVGDTGTSVVSTQAKAGIGPIASCLRFMDTAKINNVDMPGIRTPTALPQRTLATRWRGWLGGVPGMQSVDIETAVAICNEMNSDLWWPFTIFDSDELVDYVVAYVAQNLAAGLRVFWEVGNEVWNNQFMGWYDAHLAGVRRGYAPIAKTTHASAVAETIYDGKADINPQGTGSAPAFTFTVVNALVASRRYMMNLYGIGPIALDVSADVPAGTTISHANWATEGSPITCSAGGAATIAYNNATCLRAQKRWHGRRTAEVATRANAAFTTAARPLSLSQPTLGGWSAGGAAYSGDALAFDNNKTLIKRVAFAAYWGSELLKFADTTISESDKLRIYKGDQAGAVNAFFATTTSQINAQIVATANTYKDLSSWCLANGLGPDDIQGVQYEFNWHTTIVQSAGTHGAHNTMWPGQAAVQRAWNESYVEDSVTKFWGKSAPFIPKAFVKAGGRIWRNASGANIAATVDPTSGGGWVAYVDADGQDWDATFTSSIISQAASLAGGEQEHSVALFNAIMTDARFAAAQTYSFDRLQAQAGNMVALFSRLASRRTQISQGYNWGYQFSETDIGAANYRWTAVKDKQAALGRVWP